MEERKLVDIEEIKDVLGDTINSEGDYRHALRLLDGLSAMTEQDIVKPYLEKLKEQIVGKSFTEEFFDEDAFNSMYSESVSKDTAECESYIEMTIVKMDDVLRLIDNLLSEQEDK